LKVIQDNLDSPEVVALLHEHLHGMQSQSPPESMHALDISDYKSPDVTLWTAWSDGDLLGCGALKDLGELNGEHVGEIKSMRTKTEHLKRGVADAILNAITDYAKRRGIQRLSLETGATEQFSAALSFYRKRGYEETPPFGSYKLDPVSVFFTKKIDP